MKCVYIRLVWSCWILCLFYACSMDESSEGYRVPDWEGYQSDDIYQEPGDGSGSLSRSHSEPIDGTYAAEVCNDYTGSCYTLDADVSRGKVETIYFPNGGHLDMDGAELDEDGLASGEAYTWEEGYTGETWTVEIPDLEYE